MKNRSTFAHSSQDAGEIPPPQLQESAASDHISDQAGLNRYLALECLRSLCRRPGRIAFVDCTAERKELSRGKLLAVPAALARRIQKTVPDNRVGEAGLPNLWVPRAVRRVDRIPVLGSGKLDLKACRDFVSDANNVQL